MDDQLYYIRNLEWENFLKSLSADLSTFSFNPVALLEQILIRNPPDYVLEVIVNNEEMVKGFSQEELSKIIFALLRFEKIEIVKSLLKNKSIDINLEHPKKGTLLTDICRIDFSKNKAWYEIFKELISRPDIDVNLKNHIEESPLNILIALENFNAVHDLLKTKKADVNSTNREGNSPLILCIYKGHQDTFKICKLLIELGADINLKNKAEETAVEYAISYNQLNCLKYLLEHGAQLPIYAGKSILLAKIRNSHSLKDLKMIKFLSEITDVNQENHNGQTIAHNLQYISKNQKHLINLIISFKNLNLNKQDHLGKTALHYATKIKQNSVIQKLLEKNVDTKIKDNLGFTPLMVAIYNNYKEGIKLLIPGTTPEEAEVLFTLALKVKNFDISSLKLITDLLV